MIYGSEVAAISGTGGSVELPRKGLEVVGIGIVGTAYAEIQISPGRKAVFLGGGSGYTFTPVKFVAENGVVDFSWGNTGGSNSTLFVFYGKADAGTPPLAAYSGVVEQFGFTFAASVTSYTEVSVEVNFPFPSAATEITGAEVAFLPTPSGIVYQGPLYFDIPLSSGADLYIPLIPNGALSNNTYGVVGVPDYPNNTGVFPLSIPVTSNVPVTGVVSYTNSNTSAVTVGVYVVLYYR